MTLPPSRPLERKSSRIPMGTPSPLPLRAIGNLFHQLRLPLAAPEVSLLLSTPAATVFTEDRPTSHPTYCGVFLISSLSLPLPVYSTSCYQMTILHHVI